MNPPPPPAQSSDYSAPPQGDYHHTAAATAQAALSQDHVPTPSAQAAASAANGRKRKASGTPGSRGVANLTPEQLAKKRANDREAQRAIRERTRNTIDTLERRIKELESQQPYQELQRVVQERDRALQECEDLRRKLATVVNVAAGAQQQQQQPNLHELAALTAQQSPLPPLQQQGQQHSPQAHGAQPYEQQLIHPDLRSPQASSQAGGSSQTGTPVSGYHTDQTPSRRWSPRSAQDASASYPTSNGMTYEQQRPPVAPMQAQSNGERLGVNFLLDQNQHAATPPPSNHARHHSWSSQRNYEQPVWARLPANSQYTCPLDSLLGEFVSNRRQQLAKGVPMHEVIGPDNPSFIGLLDPQRRDACHPISALLIDILSKFPDISAIPEKVAVLYLMFLLLRWQICPCETCYLRLPEWLRPTAEQLERPHPAWIDHLQWPIMRRRLVTGTQVNFEEFFIPFTSTLSLNWPYANDHVLSQDANAGSDDPAGVKMNSVFESHLRDLRHWSVGPMFRDAFPELIGDEVRILDGAQ